MKIGICGGTFDPFHCGHIDPIVSVRNTLQWERIIYVPARVQPFKVDLSSASPYHRFAMAVLATEDRDDVHVSPIELERDAVSYTVDTLEQLRSAHPGATLDWIIGDDNLAKLLEWKTLERIFELANFAVLDRARSESVVPEPLRFRVTPAAERSTHGSIVFAENATVPVSSTDIRRRVRAGEAIDGLVHPRVSRYIDHYGLYRKAQT